MPLITTFDKNWKCPVFIYQNKNILVNKNGFNLPKTTFFEKAIAAGSITNWIYETNYNYIAATFSITAPVPTEFSFIPLRSIFAQNTSYSAKAARGAALINWIENEKFCCKCGNKLHYSKTETAKICNTCSQIVYPRLIPAIIVLIKKDNKILLARHKNRISNMYACIAGFLEAGESVEDCVRREVLEETNLHIKNIKYFDTQSWPFPNQIMLGFTAEWESGTIKIQEEELLEAKWFDPTYLPKIPPEGSISHRLIKGIH